ncbi:c-type cytochrome [Novosphingobium sediminicola]|uniref:Cytochrome c556 n=1 Tax=Novosphingobium sediminicola TaxID=563162 RepID=A0A7W6CPW3_9SPHN|nr:cytochrome c [Novosphingobium sediminicola]MBB3957740.1 cytochrome c556 [Novosphingobium sediminicola]
MKKVTLALGAIALSIAVTVSAASPQQVIEARQKNFKAMGKAMKEAGDSIKTGTPNPAIIKASAALVAGNAGQIEKWFPVGTVTGGSIKTAAKADIWSDKASFAKAAGNFSNAAKTFKIAADDQDTTAMAKAMGALGGTCKGCHDTFRLKD